MKNVMLIAVALLLVTSFASADGLLDGDEVLECSYLKGFASWAEPTDNDLKSGLYVGGAAGLDLNTYLALEFEAGYYKNDVKDIEGIDGGKVCTVPLLVNAIIGYPATDMIYPYGVVGIGAGINNWNDAAGGIDTDADSSLIAKFGIGCDFYVNENVALYVEGAYIINRADLTAKSGGLSSTEKVKLDTWLLGGGLKYHF